MAMSPDTSDFNILVPHPTLRIALTLPRESDGVAVVAYLNDPRVCMNLNGPPYPYTQKDWSDWYPIISSAASQNLAELKAIQEREQSAEASHDWSKREWLGKRLWTSTIRHVVDVDAAPNSGKFIGEICVQRDTFVYILDAEEKKKRKDGNDKLEPGNPDWLIPEYHRQGIMPAVLRTLMAEILVPYMNAHVLVGGHFQHNLASKRVFEKCGFSSVDLVSDVFTINPAKIDGPEGSKVGMGLLRWERKSPI